MDACAHFRIWTPRLVPRSYRSYKHHGSRLQICLLKLPFPLFTLLTSEMGEVLELYHFWVCSSRNLIWFLKSLERDLKRMTVCLNFQGWEKVLLFPFSHLHLSFVSSSLPSLSLSPFLSFFLLSKICPKFLCTVRPSSGRWWRRDEPTPISPLKVLKI